MPVRLFLALLILLLFSVACEKQDESAAKAPAATSVATREMKIVVPEGVRGKWQAVKIAVLDKEQNREKTYTVKLGQAFTVADSDISVQVQNFLPAFIMDGTVLTSVSNETRNPAVQIVIRENGQKLFKGWLFSLYPGTHGFQHSRYGFTLVDYIPAKKS